MLHPTSRSDTNQPEHDLWSNTSWDDDELAAAVNAWDEGNLVVAEHSNKEADNKSRKDTLLSPKKKVCIL